MGGAGVHEAGQEQGEHVWGGHVWGLPHCVIITTLLLQYVWSLRVEGIPVALSSDMLSKIILTINRIQYHIHTALFSCGQTI